MFCTHNQKQASFVAFSNPGFVYMINLFSGSFFVLFRGERVAFVPGWDTLLAGIARLMPNGESIY